jgi:hypothetical protein
MVVVFLVVISGATVDEDEARLPHAWHGPPGTQLSDVQ